MKNLLPQLEKDWAHLESLSLTNDRGMKVQTNIFARVPEAEVKVGREKKNGEEKRKIDKQLVTSKTLSKMQVTYLIEEELLGNQHTMEWAVVLHTLQMTLTFQYQLRKETEEGPENV